MACYIVLADWLHDQYEEISKEKGWNTREECKVEFEDLPKENREVLFELAKRIIKKFNL